MPVFQLYWPKMTNISKNTSPMMEKLMILVEKFVRHNVGIVSSARYT